jgi:flavin reductase (DIM6/NTAB) family NADH-FMN oxidoreductase RutF
VNVPTEALRAWVGVCGTRSGRDVDKLAAYNVATSPAQTVPSITIDACPLVYECRVLHHNDLIPANLDPEIEARSYGGSDYHRLYYGEILGAFAAE